MPSLAAFSDLASEYDGFIFDQFGVMHNGATALDGAPALVARLAAAGKRLGILSNSSKRKEWSLRELLKFGFSAEHFVAAAVTTSGEEAWHALGAEWCGTLFQHYVGQAAKVPQRPLANTEIGRRTSWME